MELPTHIKAQVEAGCPLDEALVTAAIEALESDPQGALTALEYLVELAELQSPHLTITVKIGTAGEPVGPPELPAPAPIPPSEAPAQLLAGAYWPR